MNKASKCRLDTFVDGTLSEISHVYFLSGENSKFFIIEVKLSNNIKDTRKMICRIIAPIKDLHSSILELQVNKSAPALWKNKRYNYHQQIYSGFYCNTWGGEHTALLGSVT